MARMDELREYEPENNLRHSPYSCNSRLDSDISSMSIAQIPLLLAHHCIAADEPVGSSESV